MNPEDASNQNDLPDGIIEIENYSRPSASDVSSGDDPVDSVAESVEDVAGVASDTVPETVDVVQDESVDPAYNSETIPGEEISPGADVPIPDTIETGFDAYAESTVENVEEAGTADTTDMPVIPVSNKTSEARAMSQTTNPTPVPSVPSSGDNIEDWMVMPAASWPPPIFMKKNVSARERFYLEYRWHSQWSFYDNKATQNKNTYYYLQRIVVIGSLIIPALISLNSTISRFITSFIDDDPTTVAETENIVRIGVDAITVIISLAVAGAAALETLYKYGENWNSYRSAAEELQAEKNYYDMQAGPYAASTNPFATFVERVEGIVANQNGKYFQAIQSQIAKQTEDNEGIVDHFLGEDDDEDEVVSTMP